MVFKLLPWLVKQKNKCKLTACFFENTTNSKDCSVSRIRFPAFLHSHYSNFSSVQCTFMAGVQNNFRDHRRFSEQLLKSQTASGKPEHTPWRELLEGFSQLVSDFNHFIKATRNFNFGCSSQKDGKNCEKHQRSFKKYGFYC